MPRPARPILSATVLTGALALASPALSAGPAFKDQVTGEAIDSRLHPEVRDIAIGAARGGGLPAAMPAKRAAFDKVFAGLGGPPEPVADVRDLTVPAKGHAVPVRVYRPAAGVLPVVVYTHGGGFEKGSPASHDAPLRRLANRCGCAVVAVGYRLAPEHKYPAQTDDGCAVPAWAAREAAAPDHPGGAGQSPTRPPPVPRSQAAAPPPRDVRQKRKCRVSSRKSMSRLAPVRSMNSPAKPWA